MTILLAVDDGLTNGNFNAADIVWLIGAILAVLAAVLALAVTPATTPPAARWATPLAYLAVGLVAFGLFLT